MGYVPTYIDTTTHADVRLRWIELERSELKIIFRRWRQLYRHVKIHGKIKSINGSKFYAKCIAKF